MINFLHSPRDIERDALRRNLTMRSREALMDALRRTVPEERRPRTFEDALSGGFFDPDTLRMLLGSMGPRPSAPSGGGGGGYGSF